MLAINDLIDLAKKKSNFSSDLELTKALGISHGVPYQWRNGALPKIEHAHQLAILAGLDPADVITDILIKSEKAPEVRSTLERIKKILAAAAGVIPALLVTIHQCILCKIERAAIASS